MKRELRVRTRGISHDVRIATGEYDEIERGAMTPEELIQFLQTASMLHSPQQQGRNSSAPEVFVEGPGGSLGFVMDGGNIYSFEAGTHVSAFEAATMSTGERSPGHVDAMAYQESMQRGSAMRMNPAAASRSRRSRNRAGGIRKLIAFVFAAGLFVFGALLAIGIFSEGTGTDIFGGRDNVVFGVFAFIVAWVLSKGVYRVLRGPAHPAMTAGGPGVAGAHAHGMGPGYSPHHGYYRNDDFREDEGPDRDDGPDFGGGGDDGGGDSD
jgi:hypothetical protein